MSTPQLGSQTPNQGQSGGFKTWPDKLLLLVFLIATALAGFAIYFKHDQVNGYFTLAATIGGLIINIIAVKPNFLSNAFKVSISQIQLLFILRVISIVLLFVVIFLEVSQQYFPAYNGSWDDFMHKGTSILDDPLHDNSRGYDWDTNSPECKFVEGAYRMQSVGSNYCLAGITVFNFAYEIQMTIIQGNQGGIVFRSADHNQQYYFDINRLGIYSLLFGKNDNEPYSILASGPSNNIKQGLKQTNIIGVVVTGSNIKLYINRHLITQVNDNHYKSGLIGVAVSSDNDTNPTTTVLFRDAKVWSL